MVGVWAFFVGMHVAEHSLHGATRRCADTSSVLALLSRTALADPGPCAE